MHEPILKYDAADDDDDYKTIHDSDDDGDPCGETRPWYIFTGEPDRPTDTYRRPLGAVSFRVYAAHIHTSF